jgi:hypothetical protein
MQKKLLPFVLKLIIFVFLVLINLNIVLQKNASYLFLALKFKIVFFQHQ